MGKKLTDAQIEAFHRDGFVSPIDVFSEDEAQNMHASALHILQDMGMAAIRFFGAGIAIFVGIGLIAGFEFTLILAEDDAKNTRPKSLKPQ